MAVKEIVTGSGKVRYRFVVTVGMKQRVNKATGRPLRDDKGQLVMVPDQRTRTFDGREEAEKALEEYQRARAAWRDRTGETLVTDLFAQRLCHPMCVFAWGTEEDGCECTCVGRYHGKLSELTCDWAFLDVAPVRARAQQTRAKPASRDLRERVGVLYGVALRDPVQRTRPAAFVCEHLAGEGVTVTRQQVNNWISYARRRSSRSQESEMHTR